MKKDLLIIHIIDSHIICNSTANIVTNNLILVVLSLSFVRQLQIREKNDYQF
jgi:hypothetical protein